MIDNPQASEEAIACVSRLGLIDNQGDCATPRADAFLEKSQNLPNPIPPGAAVVDFTRFYCNADLCPSVIGDVIVYRDTSSHLTATFAGTLGPAMEEAIRGVLG